MLSRVFHRWERRLAAAATDRIVRPFEWGTDWLDDSESASPASASERLERWAASMLAESDRFFALDPCSEYELQGDRLTFPSAVHTPHPDEQHRPRQVLPEPIAKG